MLKALQTGPIAMVSDDTMSRSDPIRPKSRTTRKARIELAKCKKSRTCRKLLKHWILSKTAQTLDGPLEGPPYPKGPIPEGRRENGQLGSTPRLSGNRPERSAPPGRTPPNCSDAAKMRPWRAEPFLPAVSIPFFSPAMTSAARRCRRLPAHPASPPPPLSPINYPWVSSGPRARPPPGAPVGRQHPPRLATMHAPPCPGQGRAVASRCARVRESMPSPGRRHECLRMRARTRECACAPSRRALQNL